MPNVVEVVHNHSHRLNGLSLQVSLVPNVVEVLHNHSLLFHKFNASDVRPSVHTRTYRCVAENTAGKVVSKKVKTVAGRNIVLLCLSGYTSHLPPDPIYYIVCSLECKVLYLTTAFLHQNKPFRVLSFKAKCSSC